VAMAEQAGGEVSGRIDLAGSADVAAAPDGGTGIRLGFTAEDVVGAALVQEEMIDFTVRAARMEAGARHFTKDPRDAPDARHML
jgi:hypothetical protein